MRRLMVLALVTLLTGCATVEGVGQDISGAARGVRSLF